MNEMSLNGIRQQMIEYGMTIYLTLGLIGNVCNCLTFIHHSYRRTASSIYFLSLSIVAIVYLLWSIVPYIYTLNHRDPQTESLFFCKIRLYGIHVLGLYLRYIVVFICIDRYLITRTNVRIRSLNSVTAAKKMLLILVLVCPLLAIHLPIQMDLRDGQCSLFGFYRFVYALYQTIIIGIIPPISMITFSILAIRGVHQRAHLTRMRRQRDRYLMRMVIAEVIVNIVTSIPYSINLIYGAVTYYSSDRKSSSQVEIESFISFVSEFLLYLISVAPFYLFILTSKPFRKSFISLIGNWIKKGVRHDARIVPLNS